MTYAQFLVVFLLPPIFLLGIFFLKQKDPDKKFFLNGIFTLCALAFIWTTPWDNYLVANSVWGYGADRVLGVIGWVPIEEYCFFFLQTIMTGLYTYFLHRKLTIKKDNETGSPLIGIIPLFGFLILGIYSLFYEQSFYLGLILTWAIPVCILQWAIGGRNLLGNLKFYLLATLTPTFYLWHADNYAIKDGIWYISDQFILGFKVDHLPLEEASFFLVTNMMVTQGLILFFALREKLPQYKAKLGLKAR